MGQDVGMAEETAARDLEEAGALWMVFGGSPRDLVMTAANALAAGLDSPSLRQLAGEPLEQSRWELEPLLARTLSELGLGVYEAGSLEIQALALRAHSRRFVAGAQSPRAFVGDVEAVFGWLPEFEGALPFVRAMYDYESAEAGIGHEPREHEIRELAQRTVELDLTLSAAPHIPVMVAEPAFLLTPRAGTARDFWPLVVLGSCGVVLAGLIVWAVLSGR